MNTDTPSLAKLWLDHHSAFSSTPACPANVWDQCVLSKPFFANDGIAIAIDEHRTPLGFIHFGFGGNDDGSQTSRSEAILHRICIKPNPNEENVAADLIAYALKQLCGQGAAHCTAFGTHQRYAFYLGVAEGDNLMGVVARDTHTQKWLVQAGFAPIYPTEAWELNLSSFRPPMDRTQISIRRTCTVGRLLDDESNQWWLSAVLGHCEQTRFTLVLRSPPKVESEIMFWYPDPTISGVDSSVVRLWMPNVPQSEEARERFVYLMAEALRQLQQDRHQGVRTYASATQQNSVTLLQRLGFRSVESGVAYAKDLRS